MHPDDRRGCERGREAERQRRDIAVARRPPLSRAPPRRLPRGAPGDEHGDDPRREQWHVRADPERDDRVRRRRLIVREAPQDAGIAADPGEADRGPADCCREHGDDHCQQRRPESAASRRARPRAATERASGRPRGPRRPQARRGGRASATLPRPRAAAAARPCRGSTALRVNRKTTDERVAAPVAQL